MLMSCSRHLIFWSISWAQNVYQSLRWGYYFWSLISKWQFLQTTGLVCRRRRWARRAPATAMSRLATGVGGARNTNHRETEKLVWISPNNQGLILAMCQLEMKFRWFETSCSYESTLLLPRVSQVGPVTFEKTHETWSLSRHGEDTHGFTTKKS